MPTYQYQCTECGESLEAVQKFSDDALTVCPSCSGRLRKIFSAVGVVFKGSGFYRTDSRGSSSATTPAAKSGTDAKPATTSASSSSGSSSSGSSSSSSGSSSSSSGSSAA
ncbi:zinc ribbon domain-containing protein [Streptomyces sp. H10-C2]|uniref:FmdB family zinc ribbon protein n=1 Tax=unclassified Streptomyces TaxID=2593676 RepID=UPI0024BB2424|nr:MULTISPECIES: FmdB family zinc ribbon protein [unclassified Streptomyces]MDJ0342361.1 zinc ribbon domain-containing protein [Streptomyces sp. PH10-H1]MDJ0372216.1 zinc ribbon domain-containing protein [Streptomyces sp. H10-C2]